MKLPQVTATAVLEAKLSLADVTHGDSVAGSQPTSLALDGHAPGAA